MEIIILAGACIVLNNKTLLLKQNKTLSAQVFGVLGEVIGKEANH